MADERDIGGRSAGAGLEGDHALAGRAIKMLTDDHHATVGLRSLRTPMPTVPAAGASEKCAVRSSSWRWTQSGGGSLDLPLACLHASPFYP